MDYDSIVNQEIKRKFVRNEVFGCFTTEVEYILSKWDYQNAPFTYDDAEHFYSPFCEDCGLGYTNFSKSANDEGDVIFICDDCGREYSQDEYDGLDTQPAEIYEWWAVSSFFAKKLSEHGQCVIDGPCVHYWGRQGTGQAILLDYVVSQICSEMGILDGQKYSWANISA